MALLQWLEPIVVFVLCVVFARSHLFAALVYTAMLMLWSLDKTVMVTKDVAVVLIPAVLLFVSVFLVTRSSPELLKKRFMPFKILLALLCFPVNWAYLEDIVYRLHSWDIQVSQALARSSQPSLGMAVGVMLIPLILLIGASTAVLLILELGVLRKANTQTM